MFCRQNSDVSTDSTTSLLSHENQSTTVSFFLESAMPSTSESHNRIQQLRNAFARSQSLHSSSDSFKKFQSDDEHYFDPSCRIKSQSTLGALQEEEETVFLDPNLNLNGQSSTCDADNRQKNNLNCFSTFSTSIFWNNNHFHDNQQFSEVASPLNSPTPLLETIKTESSSRKTSLVRRISRIGSDLFSTASEVAATPKIGEFLKKKQLSLDLNALSFDKTDKNFDFEEILNQKIKEITGELIGQFYAAEMADRQEFKGFQAIKQFLSKGIGKIGFWMIVTVLAILTLKDVIDLGLNYSSDPKQSDMNIMFNESMKMPNITFCMARPQAWSHFSIDPNDTTENWNQIVADNFENLTTKTIFLNSSWDYRLVMEAYDVVATLNSMERETTSHGSVRSINVFQSQARLKEKRATVEKWIDAIQKRNISFEELTQKVGLETIKRSMQRFQRTTYDENLIIKTKFRTSWISTMQFCFQPWFDEDNFPPIKDQGNFFTMILSHNPKKLAGKQVECMSIDFHGRPSSLSRFMEGKGRTRDGFNDELCLGMVHEVTVEVKAQYVMLENDEPGKACNNVESGEDTEFDCRSRCRMHMIRDLCNCTALTLSYLASSDELQQFPLCDYSKCIVDVQKENVSEEQCSQKCYRDCNQIRYEIDHETKGKSVRPDMTIVYLNWGSFEFLTLEQKRIWSVPTFIAALGGSIGMWLGLSILSLLQGATYIFFQLRERRRKREITIFSANPFTNPFKPKGPPPSYEQRPSEVHRSNIQTDQSS